jgi:hypothetical protein
MSIDLRGGANLLMDGARALGVEAPPGARTDAAWMIKGGAEAVRSMTPELSAVARQSYPDGHMFERMAQDIVDKATAAASGRNVARAIESAMDGASLLLRRAHATQPVAVEARPSLNVLFSA